MSLDITFCQGARCDRTETCARFIERARRIVEANPHLESVPISVAQFSDHEGNCEHYWPVEISTEEPEKTH